MSDTYIGPFGRILPVADRPDSPQETADLQNIPSRRHTAMCAAPASAPPRLPLPVRLQFGSDPRTSFSDGPRYDTAASESRWAQPSPRPASNHEKLPSVSQLLTTASQAPHGPPYTSSAGAASSMDHVTSHGSPHGNTYPDHPRPDPSYFSSSYQGNSHYTLTRGSPGHGGVGYADSGSHRHTPTSSTYPEMHRERTQSYPLPPAPSGPRHQSHSSDSSRGPPDQSIHRPELRTVAKPVRKLLREENVPGEGPCYVYEDGTRVRKTIDGEAVNAQWGVTKAGKPRKRLAIACITCREKKIKCEPAEPKCVQCDKSGRECRFQTALRSHYKEPKTASYEQQAHTSTALSDRMEVQFDSSQSDANTSLSPASPTTPGSPSESFLSSMSRKRTATTGSKVLELAKKARYHAEENGLTRDDSSTFTHAWLLRSDDLKNTTRIDRLVDPSATHPGPTLHYLDHYFSCFNNGRYNILPRKPVMRWLTACETKSPEELMTLYSMMAIGSLYSDKQDAKSDGALFFKVVSEEISRTQGIFTLQAVQSRLLLSFYCFAVGEYSVGWDICGSAFRIAIALRMHLEAHDSIADGESTSFGLPTAMLAECYRRTFWLAFLFDRFQGFCVDHICVIQKEDIFLRLPCDDKLFEQNMIPDVPYFDNGVIDDALVELNHSTTPVSAMAFLIEVMGLAGDVLQQTHRFTHQSPKAYATNYDCFYSEIDGRMDEWQKNVPENFAYNHDNMLDSISAGYNDTFVTIHAMFYLTKMVLNCRVRRSLLSPNSLSRNIRAAFLSCKRTCSIMEELLAAASSAAPVTVPPSLSASPADSKDPPGNIGVVGLMVPFLGLAAYYAADVISSAGPIEAGYVKQVVQGLTALLRVSEHLSLYYHIVKGQCKNIRKRIESLKEIASSAKPDMEAWRFRNSLQSTREEEFTLFYGDSAAEMLFDVMDLEVGPNAVVIR